MEKRGSDGPDVGGEGQVVRFKEALWTAVDWRAWSKEKYQMYPTEGYSSCEIVNKSHPSSLFIPLLTQVVKANKGKRIPIDCGPINVRKWIPSTRLPLCSGFPQIQAQL